MLTIINVIFIIRKITTKKISEFLGVPVEVRQKILTEARKFFFRNRSWNWSPEFFFSEPESESKKSTPQGTTAGALVKLYVEGLDQL